MIPSGFCQCGCGFITKIITQNDRSQGLVKGEFRAYIHGHHRRIRRDLESGFNKTTLCQCGCGQEAPIAQRNSDRALKGQRLQFIQGHGSRRPIRNDGLKFCRKCSQEKVASRFSPDKTTDGMRVFCKDCNREACRKYQKTHPDIFARKANRRRAHKRNAFVEDVEPVVLIELDDGICGICGEDVDPFEYHIDHIIPLSKGGEHSYTNTQIAHPECNLKKGARCEL